MAYWLDIVGDEPFVRLRPAKGADPMLEAFLDDAWGAHLARGGGDRLRRRRHEVELQVEYEHDGDGVTALFVEIVRDSPDPTFAVTLSAALRATGRLRDLPLVQTLRARALLTPATFEAPDIDEGRTGPRPALRRSFAERIRPALANVARDGLLTGEHQFELDLWLEGEDLHARVVSGPQGELARVVVAVMAATGTVRFGVDPPASAIPERVQLVLRA